MPYLFKPEPTECVYYQTVFQPSARSEMFVFAVTDQALYHPATRFQVVGDPHYLRRVPISQVREVRVEPIRPYVAWVFAAMMLAAGVILLASMLLPFVLQLEDTYRLSGWPLALQVGGGLLPFTARNRFRLLVRFDKGVYRWTPPMVVDRQSRDQVRDILDNVLFARHKAGLPTHDARDPSTEQTAAA